eukprot:TRINITY_DN17623_c0_g1_i1.p1 TRINITY_DN17623_c0_g1~~TRINITY_DN17623_c0_g1_i1.p1  ORF type:complete len:196 (-),score=62.16 TRINITY_DN17623_c0_g1_i1:273-860(-)
MSSPTRRREIDVMKLMMSDYDVQMGSDNMTDFIVTFNGPPDSSYSGGKWKVRVDLPQAYPYKSPSIGFINRIFHPNVDETSGSVCLDVINQTWSPMYDLINIFEVFLPQLLLYPNPTDPLNGDAAALMLREPEKYHTKVKDYVVRYAQGEAIDQALGEYQKKHGGGDDSDDDMSDGDGDIYDDDDEDDELDDLLL